MYRVTFDKCRNNPCPLVYTQLIHAAIILARLSIVNTLATAIIYFGKILAPSSIDFSCMSMYIKGMEEEKKLNRNARALSRLGASKGGLARKAVLSPQERREIAQKAIRTRWAKVKGISIDEVGEQVSALGKTGDDTKPLGPDTLLVGKEGIKRVSLFKGDVHFGDIMVPCHVLSDGSRVIAQREVIKALTGQEKPSGSITRIIASNLTPYITTEDIAEKIIQYDLSGAGHQMSAYGYEATLLIEVCEAFLKARDDGVLTVGQRKIARVADIILRACAKVGIIALIDEATGYDKFKRKHEYQLKVQAFIADDLQEWARMFPEEFWFELARLEHIHYHPRSRPLRWGKYVLAFVYAAVDRDIAQELKNRIPNPHFGQNLHQLLKEYGREKMTAQLNQVLGVMKTCRDMDDFRRKFDWVFKKSPLQLTFFDLADSSLNQN